MNFQTNAKIDGRYIRTYILNVIVINVLKRP